MVYDTKAGMVVLFGGSPLKGGIKLNDTWSYDLTLNSWAELQPSGVVPPASWASRWYLTHRARGWSCLEART